MQVSDSRIQRIHELITNMKLVKLYAWEDYLSQAILKLRATQNKYIGKMNFLGTITRFIGTVSPLLVSLTTFTLYTLVYQHSLEPTVVFTSLMLFNSMKEPLSKLPESTNALVKAWISCKRIQKFLLEQEVEDRTSVDKKSLIENSIRKSASIATTPSIEYAFWLQGVCAGWNEETIIKNVNLLFPQGKLIFIVGSVGCGKSTLLQTLLGETRVTVGSVKVSPTEHSVAYCVQQPWLLADTIRHNITFGEEYVSCVCV